MAPDETPYFYVCAYVRGYPWYNVAGLSARAQLVTHAHKRTRAHVHTETHTMDAAQRTEHNIRTYDGAYRRTPLWEQDEHTKFTGPTMSARTAQRERAAAEREANEKREREARAQLRQRALAVYTRLMLANAGCATSDTRK